MYLKQILSLLLILLFVKNLYKNLNQIFTFDFEDNYLEYINDSVTRENFSYYSFHNEGKYKLKLISTYGDADMYISSTQKPGFYPHEHDFASVTCGDDIVELSEDVKRPTFIGVYGSGYTPWSNYTLYILMDPKGNKELPNEFNLKHKMSFIFRYTTIWRIFEIFETVLFVI